MRIQTVWTFPNCQGMFTEVEVANQWHCTEHNNNLCPTLLKRIVLFVCDKSCEQLTQE